MAYFPLTEIQPNAHIKEAGLCNFSSAPAVASLIHLKYHHGNEAILIDCAANHECHRDRSFTQLWGGAPSPPNHYAGPERVAEVSQFAELNKAPLFHRLTQEKKI